MKKNKKNLKKLKNLKKVIPVSIKAAPPPPKFDETKPLKLKNELMEYASFDDFWSDPCWR